jgi:hypothetical protein
MLSRHRLWLIPGMVVLAALLLAAWWPRSAQAQCGTQASSCKSCHEVQAKDPVNTKGAWHTDHAFGDFCEYCHAGNVQATDQTAAHQGMVAWNADVKASCASCHAADYEKRAQTYASTLGVKLNAGAASGTSSSGGQTAAPAAAAGTSSACAPLGGEQIDYNLLYAEHFARPPLVSNWGNVILGLMSLGVGAVFFGTVWTWEGWGRKVGRWIRNNVTPVTGAVADVSRHPDDPAHDADQTAHKP